MKACDGKQVYIGGRCRCALTQLAPLQSIDEHHDSDSKTYGGRYVHIAKSTMRARRDGHLDAITRASEFGARDADTRSRGLAQGERDDIVQQRLDDK